MTNGPRIGRGASLEQLREIFAEWVAAAAHDDQLLDMREAGRLAGVSRKMLSRWMDDYPPDRALPYVRYHPRGKRYVWRTVLLEFIKQREQHGEPDLTAALKALGLS